MPRMLDATLFDQHLSQPVVQMPDDSSETL